MNDFCNAINAYSNLGNGKMLLHWSPVGILLNFLSIIGIIFSLDLKTKNLYKYLLVKQINEMLFVVSNLLTYFYTTCSNCFLMKAYESCEYGLGTLFYINLLTSLLSILAEIASNFNRYRTITRKFKFMDVFILDKN